MVTLEYYLILSGILFSLGVLGVLIRRNVIVVFMCIEIMLNAVNISLIAFDKYSNQHDGQIFSFMVMAVAAAEVSVGLAIIISVFRNKPTINLDEFNLMKWEGKKKYAKSCLVNTNVSPDGSHYLRFLWTQTRES